MKTPNKFSIPTLENEYLENILKQLVSRYAIVQFFYTKQQEGWLSHLVVHVQHKSDAQVLQHQGWVQKVWNRYRIAVCFLYSGRLHHLYGLGHPFVRLYCRSESVFYENNAAGNPLANPSGWSHFKKRFKSFENDFYHEHDLRLCHIRELISEDATDSVFTAYERLMQYDMDFLEELYVGTKKDSLALAARITLLINFVPAVQRHFVKSRGGVYYLTNLFAKCKDALSSGDSTYRDELFEAAGIAEKGLFQFIAERLGYLKKALKTIDSHSPVTLKTSSEQSQDERVALTVARLVKSMAVEEIYLFHQTTYGEETTYYFMLVGQNASNESLKAISQSLRSLSGGRADFVLLSHDRGYLQAHLYQSQSFFARVLQRNFRVYSSHDYHPELHWEVPHAPYHADLYFYYKPTQQMALQVSVLAHPEKENYSGLESLFAAFFLSFCRTYFFVKTYYLPHYLSSRALWALCVYAGPDLRKHQYLLEQFSPDVFTVLDVHRTVSHQLPRVDRTSAGQIQVIVSALMDALHVLVTKGGLLDDFEDEWGSA